jgi:hypothetical protein
MNGSGICGLESRDDPLSDRLDRNPVGGRGQDLPLGDELAEEAVVRRVAAWLYWVVRAM